MAISRFCHVLDTLDRTGVPILEALEIAGRTAGNTFIEDRLYKVHSDVQMGKKVALSISTHTHDIFPPHVLKMIQVKLNLVRVEIYNYIIVEQTHL